MYKDLISYSLADGVSEEQLKTAGKKVHDTWMSRLEGFVSWEITKNTDGGYTDIVTWVSEAAAKNAEQAMGDIPHADERYACYDMHSISTKKVETVVQY